MQRRTDLRRNDDNGLFDFANALADLKLQLPVIVRMTVGIGLLFLEKLERGMNVVPVFFEDEADADVVAVGAGFGGSFELGIGEFILSLDLSAGVGVVIEVILEFLNLVAGLAAQAQQKYRNA